GLPYEMLFQLGQPDLHARETRLGKRGHILGKGAGHGRRFADAGPHRTMLWYDDPTRQSPAGANGVTTMINPGTQSRRRILRLGVGSLIAAGIWPGALFADENAHSEEFHFLVVNDIHYQDKGCAAWLEKVI